MQVQRLKYWLAGLMIWRATRLAARSDAWERRARKLLGRAPLPLFRQNGSD
jgi:hypothetical protein